MNGYKVYSPKEFERLLKNNGYNYSHNNGSHKIWVKQNCHHISVPYSANPMVLRRLIKENNLKAN